MRRVAGVLLVLTVLVTGCQESDSGVDEQIGDLESTIATIESEVAGD